MEAGRRCIEDKALLAFMLGKDPLDPLAQLRVRLTSLVEARRPLGRIVLFKCLDKNVAFTHDGRLA